MMEYKRAQYSEVMARINEPRNKMQVIVGVSQRAFRSILAKTEMICF